jgi:D-alanine-D-alanine ligase
MIIGRFMSILEEKYKKHCFSMKIVLLQGGNSPEREISFRSSFHIAKGLTGLGHEIIVFDPADYNELEIFITAIKRENPDIVFIGLHGGDGEDGTIQAILKKAGLRFTGSDHKSSAIAMDKYLSSCIASSHDIHVPIMKLFTDIPQDVKALINEIGLPMVIKPNSAGSSVGTHIITKAEDIEKALIDAFKYDNVVLVQQYISGRELTVSILRDKALPVIEIVAHDGFYDYTNKYTKGKTDYICPAKLTNEQTQEVQVFAERIFTVVGCSSYGRVDFIFDGVNFYFLEINTLPGMTELSLVPMAAKEAGLEFEELIRKIISR